MKEFSSSNLKHIKKLTAADLVLSQPVLLCLKFSSVALKKEFVVNGVLRIITSCSATDRFGIYIRKLFFSHKKCSLTPQKY